MKIDVYLYPEIEGRLEIVIDDKIREHGEVYTSAIREYIKILSSNLEVYSTTPDPSDWFDNNSKPIVSCELDDLNQLTDILLSEYPELFI